MKTFWLMLFKFMKSPIAIIGGMLIGIAIGIFSKDTASILEPWGNLYLVFLEMCILPMIITAVISGVARLLHSEEIGSHIRRLLTFLIGGLLLASLLGIGAALIAKPGSNLSLSARVTLGKMITQYETGEGSQAITPEKVIRLKEVTEKKQENMLSFFNRMVPHNIFSALTNGENLKILFFAIILGIALGLIPEKHNKPLIESIHALFVAFEKIIDMALYLLPLGLCAILAGHIAHSGPAVFSMLYKYTLAYGAIFLILFTANIAILAYLFKGNFLTPIKILKEAFLIAFASNGYVAMPTAFNALRNKAKLDANMVNLILPVGVSMFGFASTLFFAFNTVFFAQLMEMHLSFFALFIILIGAIFEALGSNGTPVPTKLALMSITFLPLGLPLTPAIAVLIAIKPLTEPFEEVLDFQTNCVLTTLMATAVKKTDKSRIEGQALENAAASN